MKNYSEDSLISNEEGNKLLQDGNWESIGETTNGEIHWNRETGELLYDHSRGYELVKKLTKQKSTHKE